MKRTVILASAGLVIVALVSGTLAVKASESGAGGWNVLVAGLSIVRPDPAEKFGGSMVSGRPSGTEVHVRITTKALTFVRVNKEASTLQQFADDKGQTLAKPGPGEFSGGWLAWPKIADDGKRLQFQIASKKMPSAGAMKLLAKAKLAVLCGSGVKTSQQAATLKVGQKVAIGPIPVTIEKVGKPDWGDEKMAVAFKAQQSWAAIRKLTFIGPDGKEIESNVGSTMTSSFGGRQIVTKEYRLKEKVSQVTIKTEYYEKIQPVTIPLNLNVGLGL